MRTASAQKHIKESRITEFNYVFTKRDEIIVHWLLCMVFFAHYPITIQLLMTMLFISERDILIVHYLAKTRGRFEMFQKRCHKLAFFFGSNLAEKGVRNRKSSDVTEGPSATKSLKCLGSNEDVQHEVGSDKQSHWQNEKVGHKMAFLYSLPGTIQCI